MTLSINTLSAIAQAYGKFVVPRLCLETDISGTVKNIRPGQKAKNE